MNKLLISMLMMLSLTSTAEAMWVTSNQAAKDNAKKYEITKENVSGWSSIVWILSRDNKHFEIDPEWYVDVHQAFKDGLSHDMILAASERGDLVSQESYDELLRVNKLHKFHSKNIRYRFSQPVKIIGLIAVLIFLLFLLKKLIINLNKKWKSVESKSSQSESINTQPGDGSMQKSFLLLSTGMLMIAILPLPYDYYTLLRLVVTTTAVMSAYHFNKINDSQSVVIFGVIALLFNPLIQVHLNRPLWFVIDIGIAMYMYSVSKSIVQVENRKGK